MTRVTIYFLRNPLAALDGRAGRPHNQRMTSATSTTRIRKLDRDFYQQVLPLAKLHWTTHDRFHGLRR